MNIVEVKNLRKIYRPRKNPVEALRGVSFNIAKGEIFGILGVNGAGKSTTLNILMGLLTATSGEVRFFGQDFFSNESAFKSRMNIATAYADLAGNITVYQNLKVFALMYGVANYRKKIEAMLDYFGIEHLRNERFDGLSAGQKTRVNLCKSLLNDPASLDPSIAARVRETLLVLRRDKKTTILMTSHNMNEVEQMCDRVALLHQGRIYRTDTPKNLQSFLRVPSMEEVFIKLARGEFEE